MLRDLLHQAKDRLTGREEPCCEPDSALAGDVRTLERAVADLRGEVKALRAALEAHQHTASATARSKGRKAAATPAAPRLEIRTADCIGCGTCVDIAPSVFVLGSDGKASVKSQDGPADRIEEAIQACPTCCIVRAS